ncbi:MAG: DinB family protein [Acidobacteria bacterium]|nr:MAG: DinB family protein [Acidobacteriota bacterium]
MIEVAGELRDEMDAVLPRLRSMAEADVSRDRGPGKWMKKEILGHLIDSAANNHQRFVRAPAADPFVGPGYDQNAWVAANRYRERPWSELVELWAVLNRHLAHVIAGVPAEKLQTRCLIGDNQPAPLEWWIRDYVRHLKHHLAQILDG